MSAQLIVYDLHHYYYVISRFYVSAYVLTIFNHTIVLQTEKWILYMYVAFF